MGNLRGFAAVRLPARRSTASTSRSFVQCLISNSAARRIRRLWLFRVGARRSRPSVDGHAVQWHEIHSIERWEVDTEDIGASLIAANTPVAVIRRQRVEDQATAPRHAVLNLDLGESSLPRSATRSYGGRRRRGQHAVPRGDEGVQDRCFGAIPMRADVHGSTVGRRPDGTYVRLGCAVVSSPGARSSVDRALASGARGRRFESCRARGGVRWSRGRVSPRFGRSRPD